MNRERGRLRWHCRRGLLELDVVFDRFLAQDFDQLSDQECQNLATLLENEDHDLWDMVTGRASCPLQWQNLIKLLQMKQQVV